MESGESLERLTDSEGSVCYIACRKGESIGWESSMGKTFTAYSCTLCTGQQLSRCSKAEKQTNLLQEYSRPFLQFNYSKLLVWETMKGRSFQLIVTFVQYRRSPEVNQVIITLGLQQHSAYINDFFEFDTTRTCWFIGWLEMVIDPWRQLW